MTTGELSRNSHSRVVPLKSGALDALEPVVPIALFSTDDHLRQTLRMLLDDQPVFVARTLDELTQLAALGRASIVITDQALAPSMVQKIKDALRDSSPSPVLIAVGERKDSELLVRMLGEGAIDRFMVKPLEGRRTRFALRSAALQFRSSRAVESAMESAVEKEADKEEHTLVRRLPRESLSPVVSRPSLATLERRVTRSHTDVVMAPSPEPAVSKLPMSVRSLPNFLWPALLVVVLLAVALLSVSLVSMRTRVDPRPIVANNLAAAKVAIEAGRLIEPADQSALHYYAAVLTLDPNNADAKQGIDALVDRILAGAKDDILAGRLADAQAGMDNARRLRPGNRQLPYLDAELQNARERERLLIEARPAPAPEEAPRQPVKVVVVKPAPPQRAEEPVVHVPQRVVEHAVENKLPEPVAPPPVVAEPVAVAVAPITPTQTSPTRVKYVAAQYPREARIDGVEGWVDIAIGVTALGNVVDPRVVGGRRRELFGRSAVDAVRQWKYAAATEGDATPVRPLTVRVEFRLDR